MKGLPGKSAAERWLTLPAFLWLGLFFALPTLIVFAMAFRPPTPFGGIGEGWTLDNLRQLLNPSTPLLFWRTFWISSVATAVCLALALPVAYALARQPEHRRRWLLIAVIVPFWTNFLIRIFAWKTLLHADGPLKSLFVFLGLLGPQDPLLYNAWAVLTVIIYTYLPFAILPLYAAAEKFDFTLMEAAYDLGASRLRAFRKVFIPGISHGLLTGFLVVFIPALGSYAIPAIVGGTDSMMVGNMIAQRTFVDRNLPLASALSSLLALIVFFPLLVALVLRQRSQPKTKNEEPI